jgi:hypothetical protein
MSTLLQASTQWATRPDDQRFASLLDMQAHFADVRTNSRGMVVSSRGLQALPLSALGQDDPQHRGLMLQVGNTGHFAPTNWSFGQLAQLAGAPAGYLRTMPAEIAADCLNWGLTQVRDVEDVGLLLYRNGSPILRAATGPRYGRIWNSDIVDALVKRFGDGIEGTGGFRVPGEFGRRVEVTKENTTLYGSDRDMFVFLADEDHRIEIPNRRGGEPGTLARGFFVWNSEEGDKTFGIATFLFDYACKNRIVWGAQEYKEIKIRHTASAPDKFLQEITPALHAYATSSTASITQAIAAARSSKVDKVDDFLATRFGKRMVEPLQTIHKLEEGRPVETLWDVTTAVTAYARNIPHADTRVALEKQAGEVLTLATA